MILYLGDKKYFWGICDMRKRVKLGIVLVPLGAAVIGGTVLYVTDHQATKEAGTPTYQVATVKQSTFTVAGKVAPVAQQQLTIPEGKVQQLNVANGDTVTAGQVLLTTFLDKSMDLAEQQATLDKGNRVATSAQNTINQLTQQLQQLPADDPTRADLDSQLRDAKSNLADAQADVQTNQQALQRGQNSQYGQVTAPYDGRISVSYDQSGKVQLAITGSGLQATGLVSEYDYDKVKDHRDVAIKALATKHEAKTTLNFLSTNPAKESSKNMARYAFTTENLDATQFMNGQSLTITVPQDGIRVPMAAVKHGHVYRYVAGKARKTPVTTEKRDGYLVVTAGLQAKERIIMNPDNKLKDAAQVAISD